MSSWARLGLRFLTVMVVNVNHLRVYNPLPIGSDAFTQTLYVVEYARPDNASVFVPLVAPEPLLVCPLLHCIVHEKVFPSQSLIGMHQVGHSEFPVEPLAGEGVPKIGGLFVFVVNVYHLRVYCPLPVGSVALTQIL